MRLRVIIQRLGFAGFLVSSLWANTIEARGRDPVSPTSSSLASAVFDAETAWRPEVEELYRADSYPSTAALARYFSHYLYARLSQAPDDLKVYVGSDNGELGREFLRCLRELDVELTDSESSATVNIELFQRGDIVTMLGAFPGGAINEKATRVDKPWVESDRGLAEHQICVRAATSETGDWQTAYDLAIHREIVPRIFEQRKAPDWMLRRANRCIQHHIKGSSVIVDHFRQTFYKPLDGEEHIAIQRDAVLLDLSPDHVSQLRRAVDRDVKHFQRSRTISSRLGIATVFFTLLVGYVGSTFINRVTQGYYVWPIRCVTFVFLLVTISFVAKVTFSVLNAF